MADKVVLKGTMKSSKEKIGVNEPNIIGIKSIKRLKGFIKSKSKK
jgi:hypothetical protein